MVVGPSVGEVGEGSPEVVDEGGVSGGADVVEDGLEGEVEGDSALVRRRTVGMLNFVVRNSVHFEIGLSSATIAVLTLQFGISVSPALASL